MEEKKEPTKWEKYAKGKKPSMKRRCNLNDYCDRGIYMITIAIEGRSRSWEGSQEIRQKRHTWCCQPSERG